MLNAINLYNADSRMVLVFSGNPDLTAPTGTFTKQNFDIKSLQKV